MIRDRGRIVTLERRGFYSRGLGVLASSPLHWCSANCTLRLCWASATRFMEVMGTLNWRLQDVHIAMAGTVPIQLSTRRLRFGTVSLS
jgi:hypothetical protein